MMNLKRHVIKGQYWPHGAPKQAKTAENKKAERTYGTAAGRTNADGVKDGQTDEVLCSIGTGCKLPIESYHDKGSSKKNFFLNKSS